MFVAVHEIIGASFSELNFSPWATFGLAFVAHYIFDSVPHFDYLKEENINVLDHNDLKGREFFRVFRKKDSKAFQAILFDCMSGVALAYLIFKPNTIKILINVSAGIFGGMLPDLLGGFTFLFPENRILNFQYKFHNFIHTKIHFQTHPYVGVALQVLIVLAVVAIHKQYYKLL